MVSITDEVLRSVSGGAMTGLINNKEKRIKKKSGLILNLYCQKYYLVIS